MKDETYAFISDVKEKKVTARSARHTRTHCGKGGMVRLPSDNLSKKELMKMSGECKSYRLNKPMTWTEFKAMPDDIQITYVKLLRQKFSVPDRKLAEMFGTSKDGISFRFKKLGLNEGKTRKRKNWDSEGFYAWLHGVDKLPTPVPEEEPTEAPVIEEVPVITSEELKAFVEEDIPWNAPETKQDYTYIAPDAEIEALRKWNDELLKGNEELKVVHEKYKAENAWLRNEYDSLRMNERILEAQMEVVRLIFGGKNNG
jgi:hypothetical protein